MDQTLYPKIYTLGHKAVEDIFLDNVEVEEKVDGSQMSVFIDNQAGRIYMRSRSAAIIPETADSNFKIPVEYFLSIEDKLLEYYPNRVLRGEAVTRPRHNVLKYNRIPKHGFILFDVMNGLESYCPHTYVEIVGKVLDLETVPIIYSGKVDNVEFFKSLLETESILGGVKIEGVVAKNKKRFGLDGKPLFGKYVSPAFKEIHAKEWGEANPGRSDIIQSIGASLKTDARWHKAIQHLRDSGTLTDSSKDIGPLLKEIEKDLSDEATEYIKDLLFKHFWKDIRKIAMAGFPEWYKELLLNKQFEGTNNEM